MIFFRSVVQNGKTIIPKTFITSSQHIYRSCSPSENLKFRENCTIRRYEACKFIVLLYWHIWGRRLRGDEWASEAVRRDGIRTRSTQGYLLVCPMTYRTKTLRGDMIFQAHCKHTLSMFGVQQVMSTRRPSTIVYRLNPTLVVETLSTNTSVNNHMFTLFSCFTFSNPSMYIKR